MTWSHRRTSSRRSVALGSMIQIVLTGQAVQAAAAAEAVVTLDVPPEAQFAAHFVRGFTSHMIGRITVARQEFEALEGLIAQGVNVQIPEFFDGPVVAAAQSALLAHIAGEDGRADTFLATAGARAVGSPQALVTTAEHQMWLAAMRGDAERARRHAAACCALSEELDAPIYSYVGDIVGGWADAILGESSGADRADSGFERYVATGLRLFLPMYLLLRAEAPRPRAERVARRS